jgi:hypothetical protein
MAAKTCERWFWRDGGLIVKKSEMTMLLNHGLNKL